MRKLLQAFLIAFLISTTTSAAPKIPKAADVLKEAQVKATAENKAIFLIFGASWCEACHQLDSFLVSPEVAAVFSKYFVIAKVSVGEAVAGHPEWDNPGSAVLMMKYGGLTSNGQASLPFIALLDPQTKLIANSKRPERDKAGGDSTGFPTEPEEINWFLGMLQKAAQGIKPEETRTLQDALGKAAVE